MNINGSKRSLLLGTALAALLAVAPVHLSKQDDGWGISAAPNWAFAASGSGKEGDGGSDDNSGSGSDNSGSGSDSDDDDDDDDNSGSGSDDDDDDDDDDEDGTSGSGRSKPRVPGGSGCDDPGDAAEHPECGGSASPAPGSTGSGTPSGTTRAIVKIEVSGSSVEVVYSDGTKEEIEGGRYERKNAAGRTVEERAATGSDLARLKSLAGAISIDNVPSSQSGGDTVVKSESTGASIEVVYRSGWKEEIEGGRYELKDPYNRTVVERPASAEDVARLRAIAG
jgi:hypothetical protein